MKKRKKENILFYCHYISNDFCKLEIKSINWQKQILIALFCSILFLKSIYFFMFNAFIFIIPLTIVLVALFLRPIDFWLITPTHIQYFAKNIFYQNFIKKRKKQLKVPSLNIAINQIDKIYLYWDATTNSNSIDNINYQYIISAKVILKFGTVIDKKAFITPCEKIFEAGRILRELGVEIIDQDNLLDFTNKKDYYEKIKKIHLEMLRKEQKYI